MATKTGVPTRTFNDIGTGETFEEGKAAPIETGAFDNYLAAGLVTDPDAAPAPAAPASA